MRKKIIGFTFLFSIFMLGLACYYNNINFETYDLENETICLASTDQNQVSYKVNHYIPNLDGTYEIDTYTYYGVVGDEISVEYLSLIGFSFDSDNVNNVLSGTISEDKELVLNVYYVRKTFTVYFKNNAQGYGDITLEGETTAISNLIILFGQSIYLDGNVLVVGENRLVARPKTETVQYSYHFDGWDLSALSLDSDGKFTIVNEYSKTFNVGYSFIREVREYKVSWKNENSLIYSEILPYGTIPIYSGEAPIKENDQQYTYSFIGWNPSISEIKGETVYYAQFSKTINNYKVYFDILEKNLNYGTLSISGNGFEVPYGTTITIDENDSTKIYVGSNLIVAKPTNSDSQYEYSFEFWQYDADTVTNDITIYAKFKRIEKTYTVLWMSEGTVLEIDNNQTYGTVPEYNNKTPNKPSNAEFSYKFIGWSPKVSAVTKNANYYAQFEESVNTYTVSWEVNNIITEIDENVPYGTMPEYNVGTPSLEGGDGYYYVFEGWYNDLSEVTKDVMYEALFSKWYTKKSVENDNRIELISNGIRSDVIFKAEELKENRTFILPKDMETVIIYKASLTKENEDYKSEIPVTITVDLKNKYDSNRIYYVYVNIDGELIEPELTVEGSKISFSTNEVGSFIIYTEIIKNVNLVWLMITFGGLMLVELCIFYFVIIKKYRQYKRQIELSKVNSNILIGLPLIIRIVSLGQLIPTIILGLFFLASTGFIIYCFCQLNKMKKSIPEEEEDFIYIPVHSEEELDIETCPVYTGPKRDFSKTPRQTYYDTPYRPIYYYQPIPVYQQTGMNVEIDEDVNDDEIIIEDGEIVRVHYKRSFMSRIIQGTKEIQDYYTRLRNEISAYNKLKSRLGWEHESIYTSRETIVLIKIKGDMLCVFLALDPSKFNKGKINFGDVGKIKKYKNVPMLIKVQTEKDLNDVIKLIEQICKKNKLQKDELGNEDYHYEFRTDRELIEEGLIKEVKTYSQHNEETEEEILTEDMIRDQINVIDAKQALSDEQALSLIETIESDVKQIGNKKTIVNIGTLSRFYEANEIVNLDTLKTKKIVSKDTGYVKILASGVLDKPLIVEANGYSIDAVKMILLTGGKVRKI